MLKTSKKRSRESSETQQIIQPYIKDIPITAINDISISEEIECYTYEIRKERSISGYLNLGKGFSKIDAKVSGIMEAIEMSVVEMTAPNYWYSRECFRDYVKDEVTNIGMPLQLKKETYLYGEDLLTSTIKKQRGSTLLYNNSIGDGISECSNSKTNGLASGNNTEEATIHAINELIERHQMNTKRTRPFGRIINIDQDGGFQTLIRKLLDAGLKTNFYILGIMANTTTVECTISSAHIEGVNQSYECQGWGCSEDANISCARALAEAIQGFALAKAMEHKQYGLGSETTSKKGYIEGVNNYTSNVRSRRNSFVRLREKVPVKEIDFKEMLLTRGGTSASVGELAYRLRDEGYGRIERYILTSSTLPFSVVRVIIPGLSCPTGL